MGVESVFFFNDTATTEIYTLSLHDALPISVLIGGIDENNLPQLTSLGVRAVVFPIPLFVLLPAAKIVQALLGAKNPIHPVRVKKAALPTHIVPRALIERGFMFEYDFENSLKHWLNIAPADFRPFAYKLRQPGRTGLTIKRPSENVITPPPEIDLKPAEKEDVVVG